jgi:hypothetical protein
MGDGEFEGVVYEGLDKGYVKEVKYGLQNMGLELVHISKDSSDPLKSPEIIAVVSCEDGDLGGKHTEDDKSTSEVMGIYKISTLRIKK